MSAAAHGRLSRSASSIVAKKAEGFHLLRIDGYSETKKLLPGHKLSSQVFAVGGHSWRIDYYPNGHTNSNNAISVYLQLIDNYHHHVQQQQQQEGALKIQAQYAFSLLDHGGQPAYELPGETDSFTSIPPSVDDYYPHNNAPFPREEPGPGCGHEEFITTQELERRRENLIRDDSIMIRCHVTVTQVDASWLAQDELHALALADEDDDEEEGYEAPPRYGAPRRHKSRRRAEDDQYVKWCLTQRPGCGGRR